MKKSMRALWAVGILMILCLAFQARTADAASTYSIKVNKQQNVVTIYKWQGDKYKPYKAFVCSAGYATPTGTFSLGEKLRWHTLDGPSYGQYCSRITDGILFHSVWYYEMGNKASQSYVQYNKLGTTASHGCVRLTVGDCKWIYDNCPSGTPVTIYNDSDPGPLGKPSAIKVNGYQGWDPTDPDPENPYHKMNPEITGVENKNIAYGSKFNIKKGIKVKNSTGFDAKKLLKTKIMYRLDSSSEYKKVKKVNTKKPGRYKVTYSVKDEIKHTAKATAVYKVLTAVDVSQIVLNKTSRKLYLGSDAEKAKFTLTVKKIKPKKATSKKVTYSSSDKTVATVNKSGVVTAKKAGTAQIIARATDGSGTTAMCSVTVIQYATALKLSAPATTLDVGNAMQLKAVFTPTDVTSKKIKYSSNNTAVATVSETGVVRAVSPGTAKITAKAQDGSKVSASCKIKVCYKFDSVSGGAVSASAISVPAETPWESLIGSQLPTSVVITDSREHYETADVTWSSEEYDSDVPGTYKATGVVELPKNWMGTIPDLIAQITVEDKKKEDPEGGLPEEGQDGPDNEKADKAAE